MNEKCKVFLSEIFKKFKKGYQTMIHLKSGSPECLFGSVVFEANMIQK